MENVNQLLELEANQKAGTGLVPMDEGEGGGEEKSTRNGTAGRTFTSFGEEASREEGRGEPTIKRARAAGSTLDEEGGLRALGIPLPETAEAAHDMARARSRWFALGGQVLPRPGEACATSAAGLQPRLHWAGFWATVSKCPGDHALHLAAAAGARPQLPCSGPGNACRAPEGRHGHRLMQPCRGGVAD